MPSLVCSLVISPLALVLPQYYLYVRFPFPGFFTCFFFLCLFHLLHEIKVGGKQFLDHCLVFRDRLKLCTELQSCWSLLWISRSGAGSSGPNVKSEPSLTGRQGQCHSHCQCLTWSCKDRVEKAGTLLAHLMLMNRSLAADSQTDSVATS